MNRAASTGALKIFIPSIPVKVTYAANNANAVSAADAIANKIEKNLELLSVNPNLGRIPREEEIRNLGYRYLIVQNYLIFYTIEERTIFIHRILHGARNYKTLL